MIQIVVGNENSIEKLYLLNFDFYDGVDYIANQLKKRYGCNIVKSIDGWWYKTIYLLSGTNEYVLCWNEDTGTELYCSDQSLSERVLFRNRIESIISEL